jgi:hypothetical protein
MWEKGVGQKKNPVKGTTGQGLIIIYYCLKMTHRIGPSVHCLSSLVPIFSCLSSFLKKIKLTHLKRPISHDTVPLGEQCAPPPPPHIECLLNITSFVLGNWESNSSMPDWRLQKLDKWVVIKLGQDIHTMNWISNTKILCTLGRRNSVHGLE